MRSRRKKNLEMKKRVFPRMDEDLRTETVLAQIDMVASQLDLTADRFDSAVHRFEKIANQIARQLEAVPVGDDDIGD